MTNFPSADAFIKMSFTSVKVLGSSTSPPRIESALSKDEKNVLPVEAFVAKPPELMRDSQDFCSAGKMELPTAMLVTDANIEAMK